MLFEWDEGKRQRNIKRHGIDFLDILPLFKDSHAVRFEDDRQDYGETRYILLGEMEGCLIQIAYTLRGAKTRIISARRGSKKERRLYEGRK